MGTVYKETFTKPMPAAAKIIIRKGQRLAQWQDAKDKTRTAPLTAAGDRVIIESGTYTAKYRDGAGIVCKVAAGCRDKTAAESVLADLTRRAEKMKGGILTAGEAAAIDQQDRPLSEHFAAYLMKLNAEGTSPVHRTSRGHLTGLPSIVNLSGFPTWGAKLWKSGLCCKKGRNGGANSEYLPRCPRGLLQLVLRNGPDGSESPCQSAEGR